MVVADADIQRAAKELVERYGDSALAVAQERVEAFSTSQDQSGLNVALRVLSAVETLLVSKPKCDNAPPRYFDSWLGMSDA